jgi:phosphoglycolate phosphatase
MQHFWPVRHHPGALAGGENNEAWGHERLFPIACNRFNPALSGCKPIGAQQGKAAESDMRMVVFDLDGTLADTSADMIAAANACFRSRDCANMLDPLADAATAFRGGRAMLRLGFERLGRTDAEAIEAAYLDFLGYYDAGLLGESQFYPGALIAVERLKAAGDRVAICTNKPERMALRLLDGLGAGGLFDAVIGADTLPTRKPDAAPYNAAVERSGGSLARSMMLGDTVTDLATARAAGVPCALVTFGPGAAEVARLDPDATLDHFGALDAVVSKLIS